MLVQSHTQSVPNDQVKPHVHKNLKYLEVVGKFIKELFGELVKSM
jgi:hypothetical protein